MALVHISYPGQWRSARTLDSSCLFIQSSRTIRRPQKHYTSDKSYRSYAIEIYVTLDGESLTATALKYYSDAPARDIVVQF